MRTELRTFSRERKSDQRGFLLEFVRGDETAGITGQVYCTVSVPGAVRGNHYHDRKTEWFAIISGQALLKLKDVDSGEETDILLSGEKPEIIEIPPRKAHALKNTGKELLYHVAYISEPFKPEDADTIPYKLL